ncbi:hypothetical protein BH23PAT1_BH23PAT1_5040 [soil metagenome]
MGKPKTRTTPRRTGNRRSHLVLKLARAVNAKSPVKAYTTRRETGKPKVQTGAATKNAVKKAGTTASK